MTACADRRGDLAAHVLGALGPAETPDLQRHLSGCEKCAAELAELAGLPGLLARVAVERVEAGNAEPDIGFADRLVATAARRQRARRHRWLAAAAAGLIVVGGAAAAATELARAPSGQQFHAADPATGVSVQVTLQPRPSGTAITLRITGVPDRANCVLLAVARDGRREVAGTWQASYAGAASMQGSTAIAEAQLARLVVDTSGGRQLVAIPVTRS
ncbi:MAG: hypothetical protein M0Z30_08010 [Actinomycetota bacterium]|nr:hypothetical protein [Actinomycetota bacterium]